MSEDPKPICGIVRPIGEMPGYPAQHWADVHDIVADTLIEKGFDPRIVSDADAAGVIQGRIVKNLYDNALVVCDVSGKNPNVMFELGLRLAFDKPTIVIKDDLTDYSFDTSPIEHISYPRDLRYASMLEFKERLGRTALATVEAATKPDNMSFLKHFGPIHVAKLEHEEVPAQQYMLEELREVKLAISRLANAASHQSPPLRIKSRSLSLLVEAGRLSDAGLQEAANAAMMIDGVRRVSIINNGAESKIELVVDGNDARQLVDNTVVKTKRIISEIAGRSSRD